MVAFTSELNIIIAVSYKGNYYKIKFSNDGTDCKVVNKFNIFLDNIW